MPSIHTCMRNNVLFITVLFRRLRIDSTRITKPLVEFVLFVRNPIINKLINLFIYFIYSQIYSRRQKYLYLEWYPKGCGGRPESPHNWLMICQSIEIYVVYYIPDSVTEIGHRAFGKCKLQYVYASIGSPIMNAFNSGGSLAIENDKGKYRFLRFLLSSQ